MKFACVKGGTRARSISLASVSQAAFDLAQANTPADRACILLSLYMPATNNRPGAMLPLDEAERLGLSLVNTVRTIREEDQRPAVRGLPRVPNPNVADAAAKLAKGHGDKQTKAKKRKARNG